VDHDFRIGQIVHYVSYGTPNGEYTSECRAAVVTGVHGSQSKNLDLCVLNPEGMYFNVNVPYEGLEEGPTKTAGRPRGGTWHTQEDPRGD
jgi:hypothetical protein